MKAFEKVAALLRNGTVEEARAVAQSLVRSGHKQAAIDLHRCIVGDNRKLTRHVDYDKVAVLAAKLEKAQARGLAYEEILAAESVV